MSGATLDAGALIAFERNRRAIVTLIARAHERSLALAVPAGAVAQAWRDGSKQARLSRLLSSPLVNIVPLDDRTARAAGQLCGVTGTADVIDASVIVCAAERKHSIVTTDAKDLRRIAGRVEIVAL